MLDVCILAGIALLTILMGVAGNLMALHPLDPHARNAGYRTAFLVLAVMTFGLTCWGLVRSYSTHEKEISLMVGDEKIPPLVDVLVLPDHWIVVVSNEAGASAYAVDIDISEIAPHPFDRPLTFSRPELNSSMAPIVATAIPPSDGDVCKFAAVIRTRVGTYSEQILLRKLPSGEWSRALRVMNDSGVVTHQENPDFPKNSAGKIDWLF
jgi:hypothetical protein